MGCIKRGDLIGIGLVVHPVAAVAVKPSTYLKAVTDAELCFLTRESRGSSATSFSGVVALMNTSDPTDMASRGIRCDTKLIECTHARRWVS